jgi:uracil-DNA glycosylase family 4
MPHSSFDILLAQSRNYLEYQAETYGPDLMTESECGVSGVRPAAKPALDDLRQDIQNCNRCGLAKTRTHFVFGVGNPEANLMLIGEAPGEEEDRRGEPFVGAAGQLLDKILAAIGFDRAEVYIGNILKCRPPGNRDPLPEEVESCLPYLNRQIEMIGPKLILGLGRIAAQNLLGTQAPLSRLRGELHSLNGIPMMVTFHPAALLRNPEWKRPVWEDVQRLRKLYDQRIGDKPGWNPLK